MGLIFPVLGQRTGTYHLDEAYPIERHGTIELSTGDADVWVKGEDRQDVHVIINRELIQSGFQFGNSEFTIEVRQSPDRLSFIERKRSYGASIGYSREDYTIEIYAPNDVNIDFRGDDGDYEIYAVNGSVSIDADDGDVSLKGCEGTNFFFDLDDGDIVMDQARGKLVVRLDDGDLDVSNGALSFIDFIGDDGTIRVETIILPEADYSFNGDDNNFELYILGGGGSFELAHDDGRIQYSKSFTEVQVKDHFTKLELPGSGKIHFKGDDIRVDLKTRQPHP